MNDDTTLIIYNNKRHHAIYHESIDNGSDASLSASLVRLTVGAAVHVELTPHLSCAEYFVRWYSAADSERPYMIGGLIYHHSDNFWSIHT